MLMIEGVGIRRQAQHVALFVVLGMPLPLVTAGPSGTTAFLCVNNTRARTSGNPVHAICCVIS